MEFLARIADDHHFSSDHFAKWVFLRTLAACVDHINVNALHENAGLMHSSQRGDTKWRVVYMLCSSHMYAIRTKFL
jgi:hypothetical protein